MPNVLKTRDIAKAAKTPNHPVRKLQLCGSSLGATRAKAHFSSLVDQVTATELPVTITKRGKAVVQMIPANARPAPKSIFGCMKGTARATGDIVGPEPDVWDALQ